MTRRATQKDAFVMLACVLISILGFTNAREFSLLALLDPAIGTFPYGLLQLALFLGWLFLPGLSGLFEIGLSLTAALQLIGGGIISVLPLPFLPFHPEQSTAHYISHVILGLLQLPLLIFPWILRSRHWASTSE